MNCKRIAMHQSTSGLINDQWITFLMSAMASPPTGIMPCTISMLRSVVDAPALCQSLLTESS